MTEPAISKITAKLEYLDQVLEELNELKELTQAEYLSKTSNQRAVERLMQLAIEAAIDISQLIIIERQLHEPQQDTGPFQLLAKADIVSSELADRLTDAHKFRNVLVHEYVRIDSSRVFDHLHHDLDDIHQFAQHIAQYLTR